MHAFLFDGYHPDLDSIIFGPPCTRRVVDALESLDPVPLTRLIRGKVIPEVLCYDVASFSLGGKFGEEKIAPNADSNTAAFEEEPLAGMEYVSHSTVSGTSHQISYGPDQDRFKTVVADMAETLSATPSTTLESEMLLHLGRGLVWAIVTSGTTLTQAVEIDSNIRGFGPYLGMAALDLGNPAHRQVMIENMFHKDVYIDNDGIYIRVEPWLPEEDQEERLAWGRDYSSSTMPTLVEESSSEDRVPDIVYPVQNSERGELTRRRISEKMNKSHRQRLAYAMLDLFNTLAEGERVEFSTTLDEGVQNYYLDPRKFTEYLLNTAHPQGGGKAKLFVEGLGILPEDWKFLADQIERGMADAPLYRIGRKQWGFTHGAFVMVTGRNGKTCVLETGWILESGKPAKFVTAYPAKPETEANEGLTPVVPYVVSPSLVGDARWEAIWDKAIAAGFDAAVLIQPTPEVYGESGLDWEGERGGAYLELDPGHPFAVWLVDHSRAETINGRAVFVSPLDTESLPRHTAFSKAFGSVIGANGIHAVVKSERE